MMPATSEGVSVLRIGKWRVDPSVDEISSEGRTVRLEPLAMRLLLCLARHAGRPVELQQLLDEVWTGVIVAQGSVYQAIAQLRRTLGDYPEHPTYIDTVPRKGYRLIAPVGPWVTSGTESTDPREHGTAEGPTLLSTEPAPGAPVQRHASPRLPAENSIAVLPFVDMTEKKDQEYFADGMAEEIVNLLAKIPNLKVIGRTSSFQFKSKTDDLRRIGTTLGVAYVVEGSVRKGDDRVRITAQLIDTRNGAHVWSETYDRSVRNVVAVQDEIAVSLTRALQLEVVTRPRESPHSAAAYDLYLRGLHAWERFNQAGFEEAAAYFRQSLKLDPTFVAAAEALARVLLNAANWRCVSPQPGFAQARDAATATLALDAKSAMAHAVLGDIHIWHDWDWSASAQELRVAVELAPTDPVVLQFAGERPLALGQWDEAIRFFSESRSLDPLAASVYEQCGWTFLGMGRLADAESAFRRGLEISPTYVELRRELGTCLVLEGKFDAALIEMQREAPIGGRSAGLAIVYDAMKRTADADRELARLEAEHSHDMAFLIAEVHAFRGHTKKAFDWLDRAYAERDIFLWLIKADPLLKNLTPDSRYKAFLRKMNLPE